MTTTLYKEDVSELLRCSEYVALMMMQRTGKAFKVGKRYAILASDIPLLFKTRAIETPEGLRER